MKPSLKLSVSHQLKITPQLQQAIAVLQLSSLELLQEVQQKLYDNPLLELEESEEEKDEPIVENWEETIPENIIDPSYEPRNDKNDTILNFTDPQSINHTDESLSDHLIWQLNLAPLTDNQFLIGLSIIDSIDDKGMFVSKAKDIQELMGALVTIEEVNLVLHLIQQFDPPGVGAASLTESLLIQLNQLPESTKYLNEAQLLITNHSDLLGKYSVEKIQKISGYAVLVIEEIMLLLKTLCPYPGNNWNNDPIEYVIPDVRAFKFNESWHVALNTDVIPKLSINFKYANLVERGDHGKDNEFIKQNLTEAKWLIKSIENRNETLLRVASCVIDAQKNYLEEGPEAMKPMILKDVADKLGLHESTISRVTNQKYISTPLGVFELKYFFSSHIRTIDGEEFSSVAIRAILKKLIDGELSSHPLSDNKLSSLLNDMGINIARRTVAKYREGMGVTSSSQRKHT